MKTLAAVVLGVVALSLSAAQAQPDPLVGTWVLNVAKSNYKPGPPPRNQTSVYQAVGGGIQITVTGTSADGKSTSYSFTTNLDGKDAPVTGNPDWDATSFKRLDSQTIEFTRKKGGKVVQTGTMVLAKDGNSRTVTTTGVNAKGEKIHNVGVYERQGPRATM